MHRFHLPPEECRGSCLTLRGREAHHASRVLRLRIGDAVTVLDGAGGQWDCEVSSMGRDAVALRVLSETRSEAPETRITLVQALPKGKLFDSIIQKATELGVSRIVPLLSERVVTQIDDENEASKLEHWRTIAVEAVKQCGQRWLPQITETATPSEVLKHLPGDELNLIASLQPGSRHPRFWFDEFRMREGRGPASASVWVGPEGDFTAAEIEAVIASGARPISLGPLVLRCETAATFCLSVLSYEMRSGRD